VIEEETTNTATVTGTAVVTNVASAESDQDPSGVITSNEVENSIAVEASDSATVTIAEDAGYTLYLPAVIYQSHHEAEAAQPTILPTSLTFALAGAVVWFTGRRKSGK
jgi:hypothetical protein